MERQAQHVREGRVRARQSDGGVAQRLSDPPGQILDKWSLAVLNDLRERPWERNGVIEREVVSARPVAVRYRITELGKALRHPVDVLPAWTSQHMPAIERAREDFGRREAARL
nr:winged helix-turn-helix transcriptional regulator [Streptomyces sp. SAT1]